MKNSKKVVKKKVELVPLKKFQVIAKRHSLSQAAIAKIVGLNTSTVNHWFTGRCSVNGIKKEYYDMLVKKGYK